MHPCRRWAWNYRKSLGDFSCNTLLWSHVWPNSTRAYHKWKTSKTYRVWTNPFLAVGVPWFGTVDLRPRVCPSLCRDPVDV